MSKKTKLLLAGLIIGLAGIAVTIGIAISTDAIMSREDEKTFPISEPFSSIATKDIEQTSVQVVPAGQEGIKISAYIKAWRPEHIDISKLISADVKNGVLTITRTPFPDDFLGLFPQPYELKITVYAPEAYFEGGSI